MQNKPDNHRRYRAIFMKNIGSLSLEEQEALADSNVAVIGCGGIGGRAFEMLVRSGIGNFTIVDRDSFEISNLNRQAFSSIDALNKPKVRTAKEFALSINPEVRINAVKAEFNERNAKSILRDTEVVVDGLDSAYSRIVLSRTAKTLKIPYVFGAAEKSKGISTAFMPNSKSYEDAFRLPSRGKGLGAELKNELLFYQKCDSVLGIVPNLIGSFEAMQTLNLLLKKTVVKPPHFFHIDVFRKTPIWIGEL